MFPSTVTRLVILGAVGLSSRLMAGTMRCGAQAGILMATASIEYMLALVRLPTLTVVTHELSRMGQ